MHILLMQNANTVPLQKQTICVIGFHGKTRLVGIQIEARTLVTQEGQNKHTAIKSVKQNLVITVLIIKLPPIWNLWKKPVMRAQLLCSQRFGAVHTSLWSSESLFHKLKVLGFQPISNCIISVSGLKQLFISADALSFSLYYKTHQDHHLLSQLTCYYLSERLSFKDSNVDKAVIYNNTAVLTSRRQSAFYSGPL